MFRRHVAPPVREVGKGQVSRCWLTPDGGAPEPGPAPSAEEAEHAAQAITVEAR